MIRARFIPAGAGNSLAGQIYTSARPVHPRGGGEQIWPRRRKASTAGSSPRGRGTGINRPVRLPLIRFIPAGAGNRLSRMAPTPPTAVHPRGGGEQDRFCGQPIGVSGSSPRGRGTVHLDQAYELPRRFIPAGAGNSPRHWPPSRHAAVHPRGGGEQCSLSQ